MTRNAPRVLTPPAATVETVPSPPAATSVSPAAAACAAAAAISGPGTATIRASSPVRAQDASTAARDASTTDPAFWLRMMVQRVTRGVRGWAGGAGDGAIGTPRSSATSMPSPSYARAVDAGSTSPYAYYRRASLMWRTEVDHDTLLRIETILNQAVTLNNRDASACAVLGDARSALGTADPMAMVLRSDRARPGRAAPSADGRARPLAGP